MIKIFQQSNQRLTETALPAVISPDIVWIDLLNPTREEEKSVEALLGIAVPTRDEIREIEISNTLYQENGAAYATAQLVTQSDSLDPRLDPVSFILSGNVLVTLRYGEPKSFDIYMTKASVVPDDYGNGMKILGDILDMVSGRGADGLEKAARHIEDINKAIFLRKTRTPEGDKPPAAFEEVLTQIGTVGNLVSKIAEALVSVARVSEYMGDTSFCRSHPHEVHRKEMLTRDIGALRNYADTLANRLEFLLDATLGMISIEQNTVFKIYSLINAVFLPPMMIAGIYGMNFRHMPELDWRFAYPAVMALMVLSTWLPYRYFKKKGWV